MDSTTKKNICWLTVGVAVVIVIVIFASPQTPVNGVQPQPTQPLQKDIFIGADTIIILSQPLWGIEIIDSGYGTIFFQSYTSYRMFDELYSNKNWAILRIYDYPVLYVWD